MANRSILELETPGDSRTMFRVLVDGALVGENLTAAQAHIIVSQALDRITRCGPHKAEQATSENPSHGQDDGPPA